MTVTIDDSFANQVIAFLKTLPRDAVKIEEVTTAWYSKRCKSASRRIVRAP